VYRKRGFVKTIKYSSLAGLVTIALGLIGVFLGSAMTSQYITKILADNNVVIRASLDRCLAREEGMDESYNDRCEYICTPLIEKNEALELAYDYLYAQLQQTTVLPEYCKCESLKDQDSACAIISHSVDDMYGATIYRAKDFIKKNCRAHKW
jgi:hypothetical protein